MNINSANINTTRTEQSNQKTNTSNQDENIKFADELKDLKNAKKQEEVRTQETDEKSSGKNSKSAVEDLKNVINKLNQSDDKGKKQLKGNGLKTDNTDNRGNVLINNDFNIQDNKDKLPQMNSNMNFGGDGQPFSSFMNDQMNKDEQVKLSSNIKDIEEEKAILSTMAENMAIINKMKMNAEDNDNAKEKVIQRNDGIKKVDTKNGITKEVIVKYDTVIMNEADVEVFANLVENGEVNMNNLAPEALHKSVHVSKTLADMLAKSMEENKPVRIEFDNGISVIIKISKDGKLSADFMPSTQIAEAYLKENLPLLKQRFDDQNIEYGELNRRERRNQDREQQRKKGSDNE